MLGLRPMEIALIVFALLLLFGASRLPQLGSSLGSAIRNFKKGFSSEMDAPAEKSDDKKLAQSDAKIETEEKATSKQS